MAYHLKSNQARLHPFSHSLVTQNYEILAKQIKKENDDFIELAPKLTPAAGLVPLKGELSKESILLK